MELAQQRTSPECSLCGEPVHDGDENRMPTSIGLCHSYCFRNDCGERLFLVIESLGKRIETLEAEVKRLDNEKARKPWRCGPSPRYDARTARWPPSDEGA